MRVQPQSRVMGLTGAGMVVLAAAVYAVYYPATISYFFNDDFQWLQGARQFDPANMLRLGRYDHFYRPVIEIYFALGSSLFGCRALPFHLLSVGIHLLNTLVLYLFAVALTGRRSFAAWTALLFVLQPGYAEAVAWVGAITDLLPALWFLLTLWLYLRFIQSGGRLFYALSLVTFASCLLTHETSAILLPMMVAVEIAVMRDRSVPDAATASWKRWARYAPFALLLACSLAIAWVVNSRSYLVREGHYQVGWHAIPNIFRYVVSIYVGKQMLWSYGLIAAAGIAILAGGTARMRLFLLWMVISLAPASFFTWGNASRYLYVPAAGFALLMAELVGEGERLACRRFPFRVVRAFTTILVLAVTVRFGVFATKAADDFRRRTAPYERFVAALIRTNPAPQSGDTISIGPADAEGVPDAYRDAAAETAYCTADVHVAVR